MVKMVGNKISHVLFFKPNNKYSYTMICVAVEIVTLTVQVLVNTFPEVKKCKKIIQFGEKLYSGDYKIIRLVIFYLNN